MDSRKEGNWYKVPQFLLREPGVNLKLVVHLMDRAVRGKRDPRGFITVGERGLAKDIGETRHAVKRGLAELVAKGMIRATESKPGGRRTYEVDIDGIWASNSDYGKPDWKYVSWLRDDQKWLKDDQSTGRMSTTPGCISTSTGCISTSTGCRIATRSGCISTTPLDVDVAFREVPLEKLPLDLKKERTATSNVHPDEKSTTENRLEGEAGMVQKIIDGYLAELDATLPGECIGLISKAVSDGVDRTEACRVMEAFVDAQGKQKDPSLLTARWARMHIFGKMVPRRNRVGNLRDVMALRQMGSREDIACLQSIVLGKDGLQSLKTRILDENPGLSPEEISDSIRDNLSRWSEERPDLALDFGRAWLEQMPRLGLPHDGSPLALDRGPGPA